MMKNPNPLMLVLMFGGTTTKIAVYKGDEALIKDTVRHSLEEMKKFKTVWEQYNTRRRDIEKWVIDKGYQIKDFDAYIASTGPVKPCEPGVYEINESMVADLRADKYGIHTSNPGCVMCYDFGKENGKPALTVDPSTDVNMMRIARYAGHPLFERPNSYHVMNQKAMAKRAAADLGKKYEESNIIVAHIGSGITVGAHQNGKVIDVNDGIESDGPFSAVRSGALPVGPLVNLCFSGKYTKQQIHNMLGVSGGLAGYLGTSDGWEIEKRIQQGDEEANTVVEAMAYQVSKEIGARAVTLRGKVDAVVLTGGLANWKRVPEAITYWVGHIAPVYIYPGENELESLSGGALQYFRGEVPLKTY